MDHSVEHFMESRLETFDDENLMEENLDHSRNMEAPRCEVTMNNQGGDKLHFNGYSYSKKAISANAVRWTCATPTRSDTRCKGAITTDRERPYENPRSLVEHNHPPEDSEASIMRDIARAKKRMSRQVYSNPLQYLPWMYPQVRNMQDSRQDSGAQNFGDENLCLAGPSGYSGEDIQLKRELDWNDADPFEPDCELEDQDQSDDFNNGELPVKLEHNQFFPQRIPVADPREPVRLHVPGKPNLTITVAPPKSSTPTASSYSRNSDLGVKYSTASPPLPLPRRRGRPPGSVNKSREQVFHPAALSGVQFADYSPQAPGSPFEADRSTTTRVRARTNEPESIRAAEIVNNIQLSSSSQITEELEKVCLKLRAEMLVLELETLKAEREKLAAYRRNAEIRRDIMRLHLQLGKGIPSEVASGSSGSSVSITMEKPHKRKARSPTFSSEKEVEKPPSVCDASESADNEVSQDEEMESDEETCDDFRPVETEHPVARVRTKRPVGRVQTELPVGRVQTERPVGPLPTDRPFARVQTKQSVGTIKTKHPVSSALTEPDPRVENHNNELFNQEEKGICTFSELEEEKIDPSCFVVANLSRTPQVESSIDSASLSQNNQVYSNALNCNFGESIGGSTLPSNINPIAMSYENSSYGSDLTFYSKQKTANDGFMRDENSDVNKRMKIENIWDERNSAL